MVIEKIGDEYKINYTVELNTPIELDTLKFTDTITGKQKYTGNATITDPTGKTATVATNSSSSTLNIDVKSVLGYQSTEKAPNGKYTVTYSTVISEDNLKSIDSKDADTDADKETNNASWNIGGENNVTPPSTEFTPHKDRVPLDLDKTVSNQQGHANNSWNYGDTLNYTIEYGADNKEMAGVELYDQMTDLQILNFPITINYPLASGGTKTITLTSKDDPSVLWNGDTNYSVGMTDVLRYKLPEEGADKAGKGKVSVSYSTTIIDKQTAIDQHIYGIQSVKNRASAENKAGETTGDVTFPDEPKQEKKITNSTKENGKLVPGTTITYTMTYGSKDIPLKGYTISDEMTKLQNLTGSIKIKYGNGAEQDMPSDWIKWANLSASEYSDGTGTVFEHTFGDEASNQYGPITITYTTTLATADQIKNLDISGDKTVANTFKVNNNPTSTYETIPTNKPNTVKKTVKNTTTNSNTWKPGDILEYTIVFEGDRLAGSTITDYATDIQILSSEGIKLEFYDSTEASATAASTVTLAYNGDNIGADFKDNNTTGYTEDNATEAQAHFHTDSKLLFTYDVPVASKTKRIVATYTMTILDETFAHDILEMYGLKGTNNSAATSKGGSDGTNGNTDYGVKPPIPQTKEVSPADADTNGDENTGWKPGDTLTYTLTYGNGKKNMSGVYIYDAMTDLQNLTSDITIKYYKLGSDGTTFELIPDITGTIPMSDNGGWGTGEVWHANHGDTAKTAFSADLSNYTYGTGLSDVFSYTLPNDLPNNGKVKLEITYTTRVIGKDTASRCGVYDVQKVINSFTVDGETRTTEGDVPFEDSPKPKKTVTPEDADTVDTTKAESEGWQPGVELKYTLKFGDKYSYLNGGSIYDTMANIQTLKDSSKVLITWNTYNENKKITETKSMYMPANENGVVWNNNHTEGIYTVGYNGASDQKTVFNYTFPNPAEQVTFADGTTGAIGEVYGPVTVTYDVKVMTQEDAERLGFYGLQTVDNTFTYNNQSAFTTGDVPYQDKAKHEPKLEKTGYVDSKGNPVFEAGTNGTEYGNGQATLIPPTLEGGEQAKENVDASSRRVTWIIKVGKTEDSVYPLENVDVQELLSREQAILINSSGNKYLNLQQLYALGLVDAEHARVYTKDKTLYPGTDYTISLTNYTDVSINYEDLVPLLKMTKAPQTVIYHFDKVEQDTYIAMDVYFPADMAGYYSMANMISDGTHETEAKIAGYNESVSVTKEGRVLEGPDGTNRVIKWTVVLNPDKVSVNPDLEEVNFEDTLPEGLALINYKKFEQDSDIDTTSPTIYRYGGGAWNELAFNANHPLYGKDSNAESFKSGDVLSASVEDSIIQPVNILGYGYPSNGIPYSNHGGLSGTTYTVEYYTYISDDKWAELTSTESGSESFVNTATFTDGGTRIFSKTTEVTVEADEYLTKKDISNLKTGSTDLMSDDLDYLVNVNPHKYMLNDGNDISLMDTIQTSMDLRVPSIKVFKANTASEAAMQVALTEAGKTEADRSIVVNQNGTLKTELLGDDVTNRVSISYNDDTRVLSFSGLEDEEHYYVFFTAGVRSVGGSESQTFSNTITLVGKGSQSTTEVTQHKTEEFHPEAHGGMGMIKIDEDNAKKTLEGAVFELYEVTTDAVKDFTDINNLGDSDFEQYEKDGQTLLKIKDSKGNAAKFEVRQIITNTADENGQYTSDKRGVISFGTFEFDANKLYYWVEKKAPEGYIADLDVPHYFVMYHALREEDLEAGQNISELPTLTQTNMLRAWALDNWWSDSFGITVASYAMNATWYATNSQYRSITATKKWEGDSNNVYKLRPEDGVKFTLIRINPDGTTENLDTRVIRGGNETYWPSYTWNKLPIADENGDHYKYTVVEEFLENYYPEYSDNQKGIESGQITITNHLTPGSTSISVEKLWKTGGDIPQSIKVKLVQIYSDA